MKYKSQFLKPQLYLDNFSIVRRYLIFDSLPLKALLNANNKDEKY